MQPVCKLAGNGKDRSKSRYLRRGQQEDKPLPSPCLSVEGNWEDLQAPIPPRAAMFERGEQELVAFASVWTLGWWLQMSSKLPCWDVSAQAGAKLCQNSSCTRDGMGEEREIQAISLPPDPQLLCTQISCRTKMQVSTGNSLALNSQGEQRGRQGAQAASTSPRMRWAWPTHGKNNPDLSRPGRAWGRGGDGGQT